MQILFRGLFITFYLNEIYFSDTLRNYNSTVWTHYDTFLDLPSGIIQIEFVACGESTENIDSWLIDNIEFNLCSPIPVNVKANVGITIQYDLVNLEWGILMCPGGGRLLSYYVTGVLNENGCESDSSENIIIDPFVNTEEKPIPTNQLIILPNPADKNIRLTLPDLTSSTVKIKIYDTRGIIVFMKDVPFERSINVNVSGFEEGVYRVVVNEYNSYYCAKFVVEH